MKGELIMKLIPYDEKKIYYAKTSNLRILEEFLNSGLTCAKLEGFPQKNAETCACSLRSSIRHFKMQGIKIIKRGETIILLKNE